MTPRDLAQIFCVAARSLGAPARFVSGYHLWEIDGEHRNSAYLPGIDLPASLRATTTKEGSSRAASVASGRC